MVRTRTYKPKEQGDGQRYPDKMSTLIGKTIEITAVEESANDWGDAMVITYELDGFTRKAQTNSEVLIKQLKEEVEAGLPVRVKVDEVKSSKSRYSFYTLSEPDAE